MSFNSDVFVLIDRGGNADEEYQLVQRTEELRHTLVKFGTGKVVFNFDPFDQEAIECLKSVCRVAGESNAFVFTYSVSPLPWLKNLTTQIGAKAHFEKLPDIKDIDNELPSHSD